MYLDKHIDSRWNKFQIVYLSFLFIISFAIPILVAYKALQFFLDPTGDGPQTSEQGVDPLFPQSVSIAKAGSYVRVSNAPALSPVPNKDYLLSLWVKLRRFPNAKERMTIVSKMDHDHPLEPGFSLSLDKFGSRVRPLVYWRDVTGKGGWYRFADIPDVPNAWYLFVLSFREGNKLGLHAATAKPGEKPVRHLLGGFELSVPVYPIARSDLLFGSSNNGTFRGMLGPFGIFSGIYLKKYFETIFRELSREPLAIPRNVDSKNVMLWSVDGKLDLSMQGQKLSKAAPLPKENKIEKKVAKVKPIKKTVKPIQKQKKGKSSDKKKKS